MLERAVNSLVKQGRFEDSLRLLEEMFSIAPDDAGLSKLKARFAADLIKKAAQAQKISAATSIVALVDAQVPAAHLGAQEKELLAKAKTDLYSL
jgi:TorA maturation chaperone TorD